MTDSENGPAAARASSVEIARIRLVADDVYARCKHVRDMEGMRIATDLHRAATELEGRQPLPRMGERL